MELALAGCVLFVGPFSVTASDLAARLILQMIRRIVPAFIFTLLLCFRASAAMATDTIVTMPFENLSGRPEYNWVGESFAATLADLLDKPGLVGIRPDERNVAYKQEGLPPTAILTRATMIKIAERAGANLVILGTYRIDGQGRESSITITARVIDIREGRLVGKEFNRGGNLVDLQKLQGEMAYEILYQHNQALPFSREMIINDATQAPIGAFENFIKATLTRDREARIGFLDRAIKEYSEKTSKKYIPAIFELGRIYYESGDYKAALEQLIQVDDRNPRYDETQFYIGVAQDALNQADKALPTDQKLAERLPLYEVYNNIGVLFIKQKQYQTAINHLKPAVDAAPNDTDTLFNLGYAYFLLKDYAKAIATLKEEIKQRASDGEAHYILSKAFTATNDQASATQASDQAKKLLPTFAQWETKGAPQLARMKTSFNKINYYRYKRDQDERLNVQSQVSGQTPQVDQLLDTARNAFLQGRNEDALASLGKLLQTAPQNYEAHLLTGRVYERRGDFERATNALKAAIFWNPKLIAAHVLLGRISVLKNDCKSAEESLNKALQIDQNDQDAQALKRLFDEKCKAGNNQ
ncbi:MAG TPA: tetratricopeptide repeat protein [Blastocatellia bacterium]|nr:tetratricopeptide repeat protein [Blastocatellia bacterium]